jgi:hypothetical protein
MKVGSRAFILSKKTPFMISKLLEKNKIYLFKTFGCPKLNKTIFKKIILNVAQIF